MIMSSIRTALVSLAVASALAVSAGAYAQSAPMAYTLQADPSIPATSTQQQQDEVMKLVTAHLGLWLTRDTGSYPYEKLVTQDAVFEYPYAEAGSSRRIVGREAVAEALRKLPLGASDWKFDSIKLFQTPQSDIFFVEYVASASVPGTQQPHEQRHLARITVKAGQIANYYELWDRSAEWTSSASTAHN
jgi:uncharacterized protein